MANYQDNYTSSLSDELIFQQEIDEQIEALRKQGLPKQKPRRHFNLLTAMIPIILILSYALRLFI